MQALWVRDQMARVYGVKGISTQQEREPGMAREEGMTWAGHEMK